MASPNIRCQLSEWGLPPLIVAWFRKRGIQSLFQWQVECLCKNDVLLGGNLVYSAPTSAGKTLVGDFLLLKRVLEYNKKALVIEPFVALTREKAATLKSMLYTTKARVGAFGGSYYTPGGMAAVNVAVCTIEKANNFVNKLINENKLGELGIIVVDEIHYLGDERRGYQLELLLTKVLHHNNCQDKNKKIQIVGLSATIPNLESIAVWLNASLYVTNFRPVPLVEKIKIGPNIYEVESLLNDPSCKPIETIIPDRIALEKDYDDLCYICIDSIVSGHSTLVFCESKRECELMASHLASQIKYSGNKLKDDNPTQADVSRKLRDNLSRVKILDVMEKLKKSPAGADKELVKALSFGVAFHHAGLTSEEREIIEDGFKGGAIKALMATSTLSSGVNLPARRVIIRSPTMVCSTSTGYQREMLNPITYRQMIGRAGRKNIDTCGESILICRPDNQETAIKLIKSSLGDIISSLSHTMLAAEGEPSGLKKAALEVIANGTAKTRVHLNQYLKSTFWLACMSRKEEENFLQSVTETLRYLISKKFIEELKPGLFRATRLGSAVLASGLHPDDSLELLQDLVRARQGFCLLNDLHIIYQVTPSNISRDIDLKDWQHYSKIWNDLDEISQSVGERVGIDEITIARRCQGFMGSLGEEKERVYRRFWIALVINDLISEMPLPKICLKYRITKATVQQAQRAVAQFAGVISIFCQELGYDNLAALVTPLESRVNFSCQRDLLDLIRLNITRPIARAIFNAGYRNTVALAKGDKLDIDFIIRQTKPFKKDASFTHDSDNAPSIWVPELAKTMSTLDYASYLVDTARSYVEIEYDIDLTPTINKRKEEELQASRESLDAAGDRHAVKRGRVDDNDTSDSGPDQDDGCTHIDTYDANYLESDDMVRGRDRIPNFVVKYLDEGKRNLENFLENWIIHSSISVNFKLTQQINQCIGAKVRQSSRRKSARKQSLESTDGAESQDIREPSQSQDGLALRLEIDNKKHIVTRLYVSFDDDLTVYVIKTTEALKKIRENLPGYLNDSYSSTTAMTATQRREAFTPIKLYVQNIVPTYKVLHAAFGLDQAILNRHFEWYPFDVAWWMVNNCPNRGLNNRNSSLSLVAKTGWVRHYHHFLHPDAHRSSMAGVASTSNGDDEFLRLKDIVKSGKTAILKPLVDEILDELKKRNQIEAYLEAEVPSRLTMGQMMVHGMGLDMKAMKDELRLYEDLMQQMTNLAQKNYAKSSISLTNIRHVARVLYEDLDLKKHLLDFGTNSDISKDPTNSEILNILSQFHPFPKLVQDFRKIGKALEALQSVNTHARHNSDLNMMRVLGQCDFWQLTGRVAMSDPDLFLINRNFTVLIPPYGNREQEIIECAPRRCFVPASGWIFIAADYSQLELRLLAHFSDDRNLLDILNRSLDSHETFDVFKTVASKMYKKPVEEVTSANRQHAKQICYGIIYGMGNRSLANQLGVDFERANDFRNDFFAAFPGIKSHTDELLKRCEELGYVESLLGRRRIIDGIKSENSALRSRAERVAVNTRIQSSASDVIKLAMQRVNQKILDHYENNARLVLEMHDELIYEVRPAAADRFAEMLKFTMENIGSNEGLRVKLLVNLKKGANWSSLENF